MASNSKEGVQIESKMEDIFFWTRHDEHGYCSNFWRAPIEIGGKVYPTTEHYFQAS